MTSASETPPLITVDGPGGSGKGVVCQYLARKHGLHLLDSGALYRLAGLAARRAGFLPLAGAHDPDALDPNVLAELVLNMGASLEPVDDAESPLLTRLAGEDVTLAIRTDDAGQDASALASIPAVRAALFDLQRSFWQPPGLVADGRDMGTVVFPEADLKIYLTASAEARAKRRYKQLKDKGVGVNLRNLLQSIQQRDRRDAERTASPMRPAADAFVIDSTGLDINQVLAQVDERVKNLLL